MLSKALPKHCAIITKTSMSFLKTEVINSFFLANFFKAINTALIGVYSYYSSILSEKSTLKETKQLNTYL